VKARLALRAVMWTLMLLATLPAPMAIVVFPLQPSPKGEAERPKTEAAEPVAFGPTISNMTPRPVSSPPGMVWISGGEFAMGALDPPSFDEVGMNAAADARPIHRVYVDGFWMDKTDVTNEEFARFVKATGYVTVAERKPRREDFPGAPPENRDGWFHGHQASAGPAPT
jgi:formylglycine-generating enzyme